MERTPKIGERVVYLDTLRKKHDALITAEHGPTCINLVYVSSDGERTDTYGRQIERESSCVHLSGNEARANCWAYPEEV